VICALHEDEPAQPLRDLVGHRSRGSEYTDLRFLPMRSVTSVSSVLPMGGHIDHFRPRVQAIQLYSLGASHTNAQSYNALGNVPLLRHALSLSVFTSSSAGNPGRSHQLFLFPVGIPQGTSRWAHTRRAAFTASGFLESNQRTAA
jgi:hypothetical protein